MVCVQPCSRYYGQKMATNKPKAYGHHEPYVVCGYGPQQYQRAYGESGLIAHGIDGRGTTVAITDAYAAPTILKDAQIYNRVHHQPRFRRGCALRRRSTAESVRSTRDSSQQLSYITTSTTTSRKRSSNSPYWDEPKSMRVAKGQRDRSQASSADLPELGSPTSMDNSKAIGRGRPQDFLRECHFECHRSGKI